MIVGVLRLEVDVPESQSLKDKRSVVRSLRDRIAGRFSVSVGEVGHLESISRAELGIACVSTDSRQADAILAKIAGFAEENSGDGVVSHISTEIVHLG